MTKDDHARYRRNLQAEVDGAAVGPALEPVKGHWMSKAAIETAVLDAELPALRGAAPPLGHHRLAVVRMHGELPAVAERLLRVHAGDLAPARGHPQHRALAVKGDDAVGELQGRGRVRIADVLPLAREIEPVARQREREHQARRLQAGRRPARWPWPRATTASARAPGAGAPLLGDVPNIESAHPSPMSADRGFFGSKPFSRVNALLEELGGEPVDWKLP